jgi:hypothetical protein
MCCHPRNEASSKPFSSRLHMRGVRKMSDDFNWQPAQGRCGFATVVAVVIGLSALVGFALGNRFPLTSLVEAIERNGVRPVQRDATAAASGQHANTIEDFDIPGPKLPAPPAPVAPVILNSGTAEPAPKPVETQPVPEGTVPKERSRVQPAQSRDRRVLVVVRRVGPPYDTKVLRGRIQGGRLVLDQRDRRGITIR